VNLVLVSEGGRDQGGPLARHSSVPVGRRSQRPREPTGSHRREPTGAFGHERPTGTRSIGTARVVSIRFRGVVDDRSLRESLERAEETLDRLGRARLLLDCRLVETYAGDARNHLMSWSRAQGDRVDRVAIVTEQVLWSMVIRTSSIGTTQKMRPFADIDEAFDWLSGLR
jgi:hypothetical protein